MRVKVISYIVAAGLIAASFSGCSQYVKSGKEQAGKGVPVCADYKLAVCGADGKIWRAFGPDLYLFSETKLVKKMSFAGRDIGALAQGTFPELFIVLQEDQAGDAPVYLFDRSTGVKVSLGSLPVISETAFADSKGRLWLSGKNLDIYRYSGGKWKKIRVKARRFFESEPEVNDDGYSPAAFYEDSSGRVWAWPWAEGRHSHGYYAIGQLLCFEGEDVINAVPDRLLDSIYFDSFFETSPGTFLLGGQMHEKDYKLELHPADGPFSPSSCLVSTHYFPVAWPGDIYYDRIFSQTKKLLVGRSNKSVRNSCPNIWDVGGKTPVLVISNIDTADEPLSSGRMKHPYVSMPDGATLIGTQGKGLLLIDKDLKARRIGLAEGISTRNAGALFFDDTGNLLIFSAEENINEPEIIDAKTLSALLSGTREVTGLFKVVYPVGNLQQDSDANIWFIEGKDNGGKGLYKYDGKEITEVIDIEKLIRDGKEKYHLSNPSISGIEVKDGEIRIYTSFANITAFVYDLSGKYIEERRFTYKEFEKLKFNREDNAQNFSLSIKGGGNLVYNWENILKYTEDGVSRNLAPLFGAKRNYKVADHLIAKNGNIMIKTIHGGRTASEWLVVEVSKIKELLPGTEPVVSSRAAAAPVKKKKAKNAKVADQAEEVAKPPQEAKAPPEVSEAEVKAAVEKFAADPDDKENLLRLKECVQKARPAIEEKLKSVTDDYLRWKLEAILESK